MARVWRNVWVVTGNAGQAPFLGTVAFEEDRITFVAPGDAARGGVDWQGRRAVLPGLVNAHLHPTPGLLRAAFTPITIDQHAPSPVVRRLYAALGTDRPARVAGARLSVDETMRAGVTSACLHEYIDPVVAAEQSVELGLPATVTVLPGQPGWRDTVAAVRDTGARVMFCGPNEDDALCTEPFLRELAAWAAELDVRVHAHVSETHQRHATMLERTGRTPVDYYRSLGLLEHLFAVHCTHVSEHDIALLAEHDVPVVVTPRSEGFLGDGIGPIAALRAAGVRVALGSDGGPWAGSDDLLAEAAATALVTRAAGGPDALSGIDVLGMATFEGARVLGVDNESGSLQVGKRADLAVLDLDRPGLSPVLDGPLSTVADVLVMAATAGDVAETWVAGRCVTTRGRQRVDTATTRAAADRIWRAAGAHRARDWWRAD